MLLSTHTLLVILVMTTRGYVSSSASDPVMERPAESRTQEARGAEEHDVIGGASVSQRQGVPGGMTDAISSTLNVLNPIPYLMGGIYGMRQVMHQRLHPFQSMNTRYIPRPNRFPGGHRATLPNQPGSGKFRIAPGGLRFGGGGGSSGSVNGGGKLEDSSGGGGAPLNDGNGGGNGVGASRGNEMHKYFHDMKKKEEGFLRQFRGTRPENTQIKPLALSPRPLQPLSTLFPPDSGIKQKEDFGTPKPRSIMTHRPNFSYFPRNVSFPSVHPNTTNPEFKSILTNAESSGIHGKKLTRVIKIRVPEEMQDLAVLEISMKANGDISLSGGSEEENQSEPHHQSPRGAVRPSKHSVTPPMGLPSSLTNILAEDYRRHNFDNDFQDAIFRRDVVTEIHKDSDVQDIIIKPYETSKLQDIIRMQTAEDTNSALLGALPVDLNPINSLQPVVLTSNDMQLNNPVVNYPNIPTNENMNKYKFVPLSVLPFHSDTERVNPSRPLLPIHRKESNLGKHHSAVYYIDIIIPGNPGGMPSVNAKRLTRRKRNLDFDGWFPMDVSNPMSDDPTLAYQPPPLDRVHFSNDPVSEKPLYPVRPENPTVFVVRSELHEPEYHSVYGTENVEYYHINPQSNTVRAFRSPSFTIGEGTSAPTQAEVTTSIPTMAFDEGMMESSTAPEINSDIPERETGFSEKSDNIHETKEVSITESFVQEKSDCQTDSGSDLEGAYSEYRPSVVERPDLLYLLRDRRKKVSERPRIQGQRRRTSLPRRRHDTLSIPQKSDPPSSRLPLYELLGNRPRESQIEESPYLGSATDSAGASFVREKPPPNFRYSSQRTSSSRHSPVTSRARIRDNSSKKPQSPTRPWYLIDTRSSDSSRRREPSIASYIIPETLSGDDKVHYKLQGPVSYVNNKKEKTLSDLIDNPHLDDHMNSYKSTLIANSLSELLQIFRYTQVTNGPDDPTTEEPVTVREFRYTRPTDETPTTEIFPSNFRYTPSPSKFSDPTTEAGITEKVPAVYPDAVADTNSLDGYLFSDSEANPEYANPRVSTNVVINENKNASKNKGAARGNSKVQINASLVQRTSATPLTLKNVQTIYPGPAPARKTSSSSPQYVIYQGHSKVKVFGASSAEEDDWSKVDTKDIFMGSKQNTSNASSTVTPPTLNTTSLPTSITSPTTPTSLTPLSTTKSIISSTFFSSVQQSTTPSATEHTSHPDVLEVTIPTTISEEYEYYYTDDNYDVTDLAFGDYQSEGVGQPLIYVPGQLPPPPSAAHTSHALAQLLAGEDQNSNNFFDQSAVRKSPQLEDSFPLALSPAVAHTRAELSGDRLSVLSEQQNDTTEDNQFAPFTETVMETTDDVTESDRDS